MARKVRIRIRYHRRSGLAGLLALALLAALLLPALAWARQSAASSSGAARDHAEMGALPMFPRGYYLTKGMYNGASADGSDGNGAGVCAEGYHFASLWEILDPSNLKYNTDLGLTKDDSGQGPPTFSSFGGWVRTGYGSSTSSTPGMGNCNNWSSSLSSDSGTYVRLPSNWTAAPDMRVWEVDTAPCNENLLRVWCVADSVGVPVYLPIILKNASP